ncbi:MAG: 30S ribosomal protein S27ae [Nanoarchaeota archaeon]
MGNKKKRKNKEPSQRWKKYKVGEKLTRGRTCPRCGDGIFMALHKDRNYCGTCHYTEFFSKKE